MAGYDSTMNALIYISYSLATNLNHQETLCQEIDSILEKHVSFYSKFL
jgi:cytochrome P450